MTLNINTTYNTLSSSARTQCLINSANYVYILYLNTNFNTPPIRTEKHNLFIGESVLIYDLILNSSLISHFLLFSLIHLKCILKYSIDPYKSI